MQVIHLLFEANHLFGQAIETSGFAAERTQQRNRVHHQVCRLNDDLAHLLHVGLKTAQLEQSNDLRGLVHLVDGVVHRRDQVFDITPVEGSYERFSQRGHDLTRYLVCFVLASRYLLATAQHIVISLQQGPKRLSGSKRYPSMASEEVEESLLFGHQSPKPAQHERLARAKAPRERMRPRPTWGPNGPLLKLTMRSGLWFQQLRKAEVVAPELGIPHFAVAAEVDAIKAAAETLDV